MSARKSHLIPFISLAFVFMFVAMFVGLRFQKPSLVTNEIVDDTGMYDQNNKTAYFWGQQVAIPSEQKLKNTKVLAATNSNKWIEVDLSEQKLRAWENGNLYLETLVSTGLPWWPTPQGEFNIWYKTRYTRMKGGSGKYAYDLPNVPFTMFFENAQVPGWRGYGLHGTYWHNSFGTPRSHGCVNLPTPIAEKLFYWTLPDASGSSVIRATETNPGTRVVIHE